MKILLLSRPWSYTGIRPDFMVKPTRLFKKANRMSGVSAPLGILYISAYLKSHGYDVSVIDGYFSSITEIMRAIADNHPQIIGVSGWTAGWEEDKRFISSLKKRFPHILTVYGGPHAICWEERCLQECAALDFVVMDEGEQSMLALCEAINDKKPFKEVRGIAWRDGDEIVRNQPMPYIHDLDSLPFPDRDALEIERYIPTIGIYKKLPHFTIIGSRGCPYHCTFCHSSNVLRMRSPENIVDEITFLVNRYGARDILFYDETFTLPRERCMEICDRLIQKKLGVVWSANARVDSVSGELLAKMKKAGCWRLLLGLESGVQRHLDNLKKGFTVEQAREAVGLISGAGIESYAMFMLGLPGETLEEALRTIQFACELPVDYTMFTSLAVFPGTEIYRDLHRTTRLDLSSMTTATVSSYVPETMDRETLEYLLSLSYRNFYLRPGYILRRLWGIRSFHDFKRNLIGFMGLLHNRHRRSGYGSHGPN